MEAKTNLADPTTGTFRLTTNPVDDILEISTDVNIRMAEVYDLRGGVLSRFDNTKWLAVGNLGDGMSVLKVSTVKGLHTLKFHKN